MKAPRPIRPILWIAFAWLAAYEAGAVSAPGWQDTAVFSRWVHDTLSPVVAAAGGETLAVRVWENPVAFGGYRARC